MMTCGVKKKAHQGQPWYQVSFEKEEAVHLKTMCGEDTEAEAQKWSWAACVGNVLGRQREEEEKTAAHFFPFTL